MTFLASHFQNVIRDFVLEGRGHGVVNALSGSGKTATLVWVSQFLKCDRILYAAFNTAIVEEAKEKFPKNVEVRTINSLGNGAVWVKNRETKLNVSKYRQIINELLEQLEDPKKAPFHVDEDLWEVLNESDPVGDLKRLCDFARNTLTDYEDIDALCNMVDHYDLEINYSLFNFYHQALQLVLDRGRAMVHQQIDYNDQLWITATDNRIWPKRFDFIMVDECVTGETAVSLSNGSTLPIKEIVENKLKEEVLCYNEQTGKVESRSITGWYKVPRRNRRIVKVGKARMTSDHPIYTQERGWVDSAIAEKENLTILELADENIRSRRDDDGARKSHCSWDVTWRRFNESQQDQAEGRPCQNGSGSPSGSSWPQTTSLSFVEGTGVGKVCGERSDGLCPYQNLLRRYCISIDNTQQACLYRDMQGSVYAPGQDFQRKGLEVDGMVGSGCLVHGRRIGQSFPGKDCHLLNGSRWYQEGCGDSHEPGRTMQPDGNCERSCVELQCRREEILRESYIKTHASDHEVQVREYCREGLCCVREELSGEHKEPQGDVRQLMSNEAGMEKEEEWVYCIDVADHHNFFAGGVLVHNCQDLSASKLAVIRKALKRGGRALFVGDRNQAIYGFAGAKTDSVDNIIAAMRATEMPLSICYRCDTSILDEVREFVPEIEARPDAAEGLVRDTGYEQMMKEIHEGDLILCRTNAPLLKLCFTLISDGVSAQIKGRDIGRNLLSTACKVQKASGREFMWKEFPKYAQRWGNKVIEKILATNGDDKEDPKIESINDRLDCLVIIWTRGEVTSYRDMERVVEEIFSDRRPSVWLSSVHRAKGLENERVFIIRPDLLPGPWAKPGTWNYVQEENLAYVAKTRAQHELVYVHKNFSPPQDEGQLVMF